ncbi:hypothetical protein [Corynebacterium striatum]
MGIVVIDTLFKKVAVDGTGFGIKAAAFEPVGNGKDGIKVFRVESAQNY